MCALNPTNYSKPCCYHGFTLIELMVVLAIVAIIAAVAYPSYRHSMLKSRRSDAHVALTDTAQTLERCYSEYGSYGTTSCSIQNNDTLTSPEGFYTISVSIPSSTYFKLRATPTSKGSQNDDTTCAVLTLDQTGQQTAQNASGGDTTGTCW